MNVLLIIILIFSLSFILLAVSVILLRTRRRLRKQKNYERGLKMVPILMHLPPISENTETSGRDTRDITEESISRAQIIYGILARTLKKGFKSQIYGQRHFSFEVIAHNGFVYFYAAVPVAMVELVKQAVVSAYPTTRLEETSDHN